MKPLAGVELDDSSHSRASRQARDEFVQQVFAAAQLPLLRIPAKRGYEVRDIADRILPVLGGDAAAPAAPIVFPTTAPITATPAREDVTTSASGTADNSPTCPKCDVPMTLRTTTKGERQGEQFHGCPNYPRCRQTVPVPSAA